MNFSKEDFYFDLPEELIAQKPLADRSSSRLLTLDKKTGNMEHHIFSDILEYLNEYGFPVYENFINYEGKVEGYIYCSVSKLDRDNDKKDDTMFVSYYTDSSDFTIKNK